MIDLEFTGRDRNSKAVVNAWKAYLDHLNDNSLSIEVWGSRREDFFVDLLYAMAVSLGYDYDKTHIRRTSYYPKGFGDTEQDQLSIRRAIRELLEGKRWLPTWTVMAQQQPQQEDLATSQQLSQSNSVEQPTQQQDASQIAPPAPGA